MIGKIIGSGLLILLVAFITMASVAPQEKWGLQIWTYLIWFVSGGAIALTFAR